MNLSPRSWRRAAASATALATLAALAVTSAPADASVRKWTDAHLTGAKPTPKGQQASLRGVSMPALAQVGAPNEAMVGRTVKRSLATQLTAKHTKDFGMVGVTWARATGQTGVSVQVRTRTNGTWSSWTTLDADENNDAGPGTRQGSEALWVGKADGIAARVRSSSGTPPRDVRIDLIDPGTGPTRSTSATSTSSATADRTASTSRSLARPAALTTTADSNPTYIPEPSVISRSAWGAKKNKSCDSPQVASQTLGVIVHHTAGSNSYSKSKSDDIVRGIQAFHMNGRGWCDIGYNYLVDKYGQIFEGRSGDISRYQVRGAHAGNFTVNTYGTGISMMGNLDKAKPSSSMKSAMVKLVSWRLATHYLPATGTYSIAGHTLNRIAGHRDVRLSGIRPATATACPGKYGVAFLTTLRSDVKAKIATYATPIEAQYQALGSAVTGPVYVGERPAAAGWRTQFDNGDILYKDSTTGAHFVADPVLATFSAVGSVSGSYGFPTSDLTGPAGQQVQHFEGGSIYQVSTSAAYALGAKIDAKYTDLGAYSSQLGAPTASETTSGDVTTATFEHGTITYDASTDTTTVS